MVHTCVDSALKELSLISTYARWTDEVADEILACKLDLRFLRMIFWSLSTWDHTDAETKNILEPLINASQVIWGKSGKELVAAARHLPIENREMEYWVLFSSDLKGKIQQCKQQFEELCELVLQCPLKCKSFKMKQILQFLDAIFKNTKDLSKYKPDDKIVLLNNQIETLEQKLRLLHNLFNLSPKQWRNSNEMRDFKVAVHAFANNAACLLFLYWVKAVDEELTAKMNLLLLDVLGKIKPCVPVFKAFYIRSLKEIKSRQFDSLLLGQIVHIFLDLLLENLVGLLKDDFQNFEECLMFLISFLANPPDQYADDEEFMTMIAEIEVLINEDLYLILSIDDMKQHFSHEKVFLSDFMTKIEIVKGKIQRVYALTRDSCPYNLPRTNGLGFFNFLLQNLGFLKEKLSTDTNFIPFAKHLIIKIEEELMSLRHYLNDLFERQNEQKEQKDTWLKVVNLAYQTEYAINSCSVIGHPVWYSMACLMDVLDEIKVVKSKLKMIEGKRTYDIGVLHCSAISPNKLSETAWTSGFNETVVVGFEEETDIIVGNLIRGSEFLGIVAIVGMPGLGKTTLAKTVYNVPTVRYHFHMFAYCIVSQVHNNRKILLDILSDIMGKDDKMYDMKEEDLAERLYKCLKGRRYLIVMDDIWDIKAWDEVKRSFPDDKNGSRVIFTTRIQNVALQAKSDCILHHLRFLSDEECWELLRKKAFRADGCPQLFLEVGQLIAKNCKGLPLAVVLVAGLLARTERSLSWWNKISETIGSYVSTEGCMDVLELSYQHLPHYLKPCFLYFGAFAEDTLIRVNKLTLLWIAEGFVQNSNRINLENVAKEYLLDLVDRSLVIATERSSNGGIKSCRVHDVVHDFCQAKAQEENFFLLMHGYEASNLSNSTVCNPYRVCIQLKGASFIDAKAICPSIHSLLCSRKSENFYHDPPIISSFKLVQVMELGEFRLPTSFMEQIALLVHLRFIAISYPHFSRTKVPSSISNLWNLETLIVRANRRFNLELPETIWNMTRLRHVDVGWCYLSNSGAKKPEAYPQMVNLESFSSPTLYSGKYLEELLQRLPSLRKLSYQYAVPWRNRFQFPRLDSLSKLVSLKVTCLTQLHVDSSTFPSTLKKLSLSGCFLPWESIPAIMKMPCLEVLKLLENSFVGHSWDTEDIECPKLKFLKLEQLHFTQWIAFSECFPSLEVLVVNGCYLLDKIPPCFGEICTLKRIEVYACREAAASVVQIQEEQVESGNEEFQVIISESIFSK